MPEPLRLPEVTRLFHIILGLLILSSCGTSETRDDLRLLTSEVDAMLAGEPNTNAYTNHLGYMPDQGRKLRVNPVGGTLAKVFNDSNYLHIEAASSLGFEPMRNLHDVWEKGARMVKIESCREYFVDELTHSVPFLVPEAAALLADIGRTFTDTLQARGGGDYRIKVTSVTRTPEAVSKLKHRNVNASANSAHQYGTTFDISYAKFICDSATVVRTQEDLKNLLAEILKAQRDSNKCYIKYERKQGCFHITARPVKEWKTKS